MPQRLKPTAQAVERHFRLLGDRIRRLEATLAQVSAGATAPVFSAGARKRSAALGFRVALVKTQPDEVNPPDASSAVVAEPKSPADIEKQAQSRLVLAQGLIEKNAEAARRRLMDLIRDYPTTKAAQEAKRLLQQLE